MIKKRLLAVLMIFCLCIPIRAYAAGEDSQPNGEKELSYTDFAIAYGGNADESSAGIQTFSLDAYQGSFGQQLDGIAKEAYRLMEANFLESGSASSFSFEVPEEYGLSVTVGIDEDEEPYLNELGDDISYAMSSALGAFLYDYPQVFWMHGMQWSWSFSGRYVDNHTKIEWSLADMTLTPKLYYENADQDMPAFNAGVQQAVSILTSQFNADDTNFEKARKIHDWVMNQVTYDYEAAANSGNDAYMYAHTAYPVFAEGWGNKVVCEGYAKAFKILCDQFGIPCVLASGEGNGGAHMWNLVQMPDENWYAVDATWDDSGDGNYDVYFAVGSNSQGFSSSFSSEHILHTAIMSGGMSFTYPVLSEEAYVPDVKPEVVLGDITQDSVVNLADLSLMLQVVNERVLMSELSEAQIKAGDVAQSPGEPTGTINLGDLARLLQYVNERITEL